MICRDGYKFGFTTRKSDDTDARWVTDVIVLDDNDKLVANGCAICHPNDHFIRSEGRKVALLNAIEELPREERAIIIKAWLSRVPDGIAHARF